MNITNVTIGQMGNIGSMKDLALFSNEMVGGLIGFGIVLMVAVGFFISLKSMKKEMFESVAGSMFAATIVAILLRFVCSTSLIIGETVCLVNDKLMWGSIVITALIVFFGIVSSQS